MTANAHQCERRNSGVVYVLALLLLALFSTLAVAFAARTDMNMRTSSNFQNAQAARLAAESGMAFANRCLSGIYVEGPGDPNMLQSVYNCLLANVGSGNTAGQQIGLSGNTISVPTISMPGNASSFSFSVTRLDPSTLRLLVVGQADGNTRTVSMNYAIGEDTSVLKYALASRSRVFITDGAVIDGDICSTWDRTNIGGYDIPPFLTEAGTTVVGKIKTVMSQADFEENDSQDYIEGEDEGLSYDEPRFSDYTTDDFDTSIYKAGTININDLYSPDSYDHDSWFPDSSNRRRKLDRPIYTNKTFDKVYIPVGFNPKFVNCTFNQIIYIDTDENKTLDQWSHGYYDEHAIPGREYRSDDRYNDHSNNVVFEDCTFNGAVITAVPRDYWWSKNALTFEGTTTFTNTYMPESTILAPNFGVDIGGRGYDSESNPDSKLTGVIVGGIVDIRGTANIEGTILSMYYPDTDRGSAARYYGSNIGCYDDGGETAGASGLDGNIRIVPRPDNALPFGMQKKYSIKPNADSYTEVIGS